MANEVVERDKLVELIDEFIQPFKKDSSVANACEDNVPIAAAECLAQETGKTVNTVARALYRIKKENTSGFVKLKTADWIVAVGMGRPDLFHNSLEVISQGNGRKDSGQLPKRKKRLPVPLGVPTKRCPGPLCQGQSLPLTKEFWSFYKTGDLAGTPRRYCKECDSLKTCQYRKERQFRDPQGYRKSREVEYTRKRKHQEWQYIGLISASKVQFAVEELCQILGPEEAARRIGVHRATIYEWRRRAFSKMRKEFAARVLKTLQEVRNGSGLHKT